MYGGDRARKPRADATARGLVDLEAGRMHRFAYTGSWARRRRKNNVCDE